eukprot:snap_masked-scaffold_10-processed-gene-3.25-mRNA-1 protein AED:1.00 eAED:1.00 QI:0/0/0/0/1/1/2/0/89
MARPIESEDLTQHEPVVLRMLSTVKTINQQDHSFSNNFLNLVLDFPKSNPELKENSNHDCKTSEGTSSTDPVVQVQDDMYSVGTRHSIK